MALIFLVILIVLTFRVSSFIQSNWRDFIANDEWFPLLPTSIYWIIRFEEKAVVVLQAATEAKNSSQVFRCTLADLNCLAGGSH